MLLYHGTTKRAADTVLKEGLKPRGRRRSTWKAASSKHAVYLTDAYAPYFSFNAGSESNEDELAVLVIDTDRLDTTRMVADEDALEQGGRLSDGLPGTMLQRTRWYRDNSFLLAEHGYGWDWSLKALGTCCYHGTIPPEAVTRTVHWSDKELFTLHFIFDPSITLMNYAVVGARYRWMMQEFAGVDTGHVLSDFDRFGIRVDVVHELFSKVNRVDHRKLT